MRVAVVGRGRAARALVPRWRAAGIDIVDERGRADLDLTAESDVIVVAVSDGAIVEVATRLAARASAAGEVFVHLAGSLPASVMRTSPDRPRAVGCMHPLVALAEVASGGTEPLNAVAGIDGEPAGVVAAEDLARAAGLRPVRVDAGRKTAYHAAAVTVAGHATALFRQAMTLMGEAGIGADDARAALQPLFVSAATNLALAGPEVVSTGPIVRGDVATVTAHLAAIHDPIVRATYRLLARTQLELARAQLSPSVIAALVKVLDEAG